MALYHSRLINRMFVVYCIATVLAGAAGLFTMYMNEQARAAVADDHTDIYTSVGSGKGLLLIFGILVITGLILFPRLKIAERRRHQHHHHHES